MLFLPAIADSAPRHIHSSRQCGIGDDAAAPDGGNEIVLTDDSLSIADQVFEKIKYLGCNGNYICAAPQLAAVGVQHVIVEKITQISVSLDGIHLALF